MIISAIEYEIKIIKPSKRRNKTKTLIVWTSRHKHRLRKEQRSKGLRYLKNVLRHIENKCGCSESFISENTSH